jgi:hypothetical protein
VRVCPFRPGGPAARCWRLERDDPDGEQGQSEGQQGWVRGEPPCAESVTEDNVPCRREEQSHPDLPSEKSSVTWHWLTAMSVRACLSRCVGMIYPSPRCFWALSNGSADTAGNSVSRSTEAELRRYIDVVVVRWTEGRGTKHNAGGASMFYIQVRAGRIGKSRSLNISPCVNPFGQIRHLSSSIDHLTSVVSPCAPWVNTPHAFGFVSHNMDDQASHFKLVEQSCASLSI